MPYCVQQIDRAWPLVPGAGLALALRLAPSHRAVGCPRRWATVASVVPPLHPSTFAVFSFSLGMG